MTRRKVHELAQALILEELAKLVNIDKTDKEREFLIKVFKETKEEEEAFEDGQLDNFSVDQLEKMLLEDLSNEHNQEDNSDSE